MGISNVERSVAMRLRPDDLEQISKSRDKVYDLICEIFAEHRPTSTLSSHFPVRAMTKHVSMSEAILKALGTSPKTA